MLLVKFIWSRCCYTYRSRALLLVTRSPPLKRIRSSPSSRNKHNTQHYRRPQDRAVSISPPPPSSPSSSPPLPPHCHPLDHLTSPRHHHLHPRPHPLPLPHPRPLSPPSTLPSPSLLQAQMMKQTREMERLPAWPPNSPDLRPEPDRSGLLVVDGEVDPRFGR